MFIAKNVKLLCLIIVITLIFAVAIINRNRNSTDITHIYPTENRVTNKTENKDNHKDNEASEDEVFLHVIKNKNNYNNVEADIKIKETQEKLEADISLIPENIIGNDLSIEHSPEDNGSFVIINSVGYEKFTLNELSANVYIKSVNSYAENLNENIIIYNLIAPTSSEFNMPNEYKYLSGSQKDGINYAYSNMNEKIITIDAYSNLEAHKSDYLYFKTDHHWTALGAYRAYESFMQIKGEEAVPLESYKRIDSENKYLGSIYNMTKNERLENNLDDIWYYNTFLSLKYSSINRDETSWSSSQIIFPSYFGQERKYSAFMGGDTAFSHIKVDSNIDKKILVIKDSYGNAFIPFLLPHYGDIYVADPRYFKNNIFDVIKENEIDEVLIINYATVLQLPVFSQMLGEMTTARITSGTAINSKLP